MEGKEIRPSRFCFLFQESIWKACSPCGHSKPPPPALAFPVPSFPKKRKKCFPLHVQGWEVLGQESSPKLFSFISGTTKLAACEHRTFPAPSTQSIPPVAPYQSILQMEAQNCRARGDCRDCLSQGQSGRGVIFIDYFAPTLYRTFCEQDFCPVPPHHFPDREILCLQKCSLEGLQGNDSLPPSIWLHIHICAPSPWLPCLAQGPEQNQRLYCCIGYMFSPGTNKTKQIVCAMVPLNQKLQSLLQETRGL